MEVVINTSRALILAVLLSNMSFIYARTGDSKQGNNVQGNGIDTCQVMPKFFISFAGREVISEGECFWDFMSCSKRTRGNDKGCCKGRFEICCHQFRPAHNEHKPVPDSELGDSLISGSTNMEESVVPPEELHDVPTTTPSPSTTESMIPTTSKKSDQPTTTPVDMIIETTPGKEDSKESNDEILSDSNMESTTMKVFPTTQKESDTSSTNIPMDTTTKKESWYIPKASTQAPPSIGDCVWKFNGCIQRKFRAMENEEVCYAIFEECKMISMGMRAPVTTDELPKPISSKPNKPSFSTEANKPIISPTNEVIPETDMKENAEFTSTPSKPFEEVSTTPGDGLTVSTESSPESSFETTPLTMDQGTNSFMATTGTTDIDLSETSSTPKTDDITTTTLTNITNDNESQSKPKDESTTSFPNTDSTTPIGIDSQSTTTVSNTNSTTLINTDDQSTTSVPSTDVSTLTNNEDQSTTAVPRPDLTTINNSDESTESIRPTTLTPENETTSTSDPTSSVTDISMETTTGMGITQTENTEQGDTNSKPEEQSTKLEGVEESQSTTVVPRPDLTTIKNSDESTESIRPTTLTPENETTSTSDPTLSVTDISMETTTGMDSTQTENTEEGDTNSTPEEQSTKLEGVEESQSTTEIVPITQNTTPSLIDLVTGAIESSGSNSSSTSNPLNAIPYTTDEDNSPKVYSNIFECVWAFNGCVKRGKSEEECRKSFRDCDDRSR
nr:mucin-5AC-like isoform X2 [Lepeophtheirus salmonis]